MSVNSYSILPGLLLNGMLYVSIIKGLFDAEKVGAFIDVLLPQMNLFHGQNSVIVMDNCRIHKLQYILDMIESRYVSQLFIQTINSLLSSEG